jgi:hypothetical protein
MGYTWLRLRNEREDFPSGTRDTLILAPYSGPRHIHLQAVYCRYLPIGKPDRLVTGRGFELDIAWK